MLWYVLCMFRATLYLVQLRNLYPFSEEITYSQACNQLWIAAQNGGYSVIALLFFGMVF